jgi:hypothetical protein
MFVYGMTEQVHQGQIIYNQYKPSLQPERDLSSMSNRNRPLIALLACTSIGLLSTGITITAFANQNTIATEPAITENTISGKITDVIESAGYTYAEVDTGTTKVWAATTTSDVKVGDTISFSASMPMQKYHSKSLNREFPLVYFAASFNTAPAATTTASATKASPHEHITRHQTTRPLKEFSKADGGNTIAELYANKDKLKGKTVHLRGQVTKVTNNVMGKNWLHISDSSTADDLTVTSSNSAAMDDIVVIDGKLSLDKDYGYGYVYPLIVEDAAIVKE